MSKPIIYLAGGISGLSWAVANDWREHVQDAIPEAHCLSPLRGKSYLAGEESIAGSYSDFVMSTPRAITTRDRFDAMRCDILFVNLLENYTSRVSIGTVMEIAWADAVRTPTILCMEEGGIHDHPMIRESVGWVVPSLAEGIAVARSVLMA